MKKTIAKPVNWQDFEFLCKILWGEIWEISDKIKKNGRLGQPQAGIDIYGVPKGKTNYYGIQCKGKDDYADAKITKKEINVEIEKAKKFSPQIECLVFATTANKDASIEQYVRELDIESRKNGGFEILIYCWEDIADLIEVNRTTFNYYILQNQFKTNSDIEVLFSNESATCTINPTFKKIITTYMLKHKAVSKINKEPFLAFKPMETFSFPFSKKKVNYSWATFSIAFKNTGNSVIEDYKLYITPEEGNISDISGYLGNVIAKLDHYKFSSIHVFEEEKYAVYAPKDNKPLIQKDGRSFELHILAALGCAEVKIKYELLARDFDKAGELILKIEPKFEIEEKIVWVDEPSQVKSDEITIEYNVREEPDSLLA
jgi:hypothetical protein